MKSILARFSLLFDVEFLQAVEPRLVSLSPPWNALESILAQNSLLLSIRFSTRGKIVPYYLYPLERLGIDLVRLGLSRESEMNIFFRALCAEPS